MRFSLLVQASPLEAMAHSALNYARTLLEAGHSLDLIFFYGDAALHAPSEGFDQISIATAWQDLALKHGLTLICCTSSRIRRGLTTELKPPFKIGTLAQLALSFEQCDRVLNFD